MSDRVRRGTLDARTLPALLRSLRRDKKTGPLRLARGRVARDALGERKAGIIHDGLMAVKEQQLQRAGRSA